MFIIPIPPTSSETVATPVSSIVIMSISSSRR